IRVDPIQQLVDQGSDVRHEPLQYVRTESSMQHTAQALVVWRVTEQHGAREQALEALELGARAIAAVHHPAPGTLRREARIAQHRLDVVVPRQQPGTAEELLAPVARPRPPP